MPDGTSVGHVHLRVSGIPEAERFYRDVLGLDVTARRSGATFYASGGYHHYLATNIWHSQNAPKRSGTPTGLASWHRVQPHSTRQPNGCSPPVGGIAANASRLPIRGEMSSS